MRAPALRASLAALLLVCAGGLACARTTPEALRGTAAAPVVTDGYSERGQRDEQIRVWRQALAADTGSALVLGQLAALHLQRAREGGGWDDITQAEALARHSLGRRTFRNAATTSTLISALLAQHRFLEAHALAEALVAREPGVPEYVASLADVAMELGMDQQADTLFRSLWAQRGTLSIAARLARWLELHGNVTQARALLETARADAVSRRDVARETQAWFHFRVAELELRAGRLNHARRAADAGLAIEPNDHRLLTAMARIATADGDQAAALRWGERSLAQQLDPATLGVLADAASAMNDTARAATYLDALTTSISAQPGAYHRAWSLHLLDHGLQVPRVLAMAEAELRERKDVYGYDVLAWALAKSGRTADARVAMQQALRLGTRDPLLRRHAEALGMPVAAGPIALRTR